MGQVATFSCLSITYKLTLLNSVMLFSRSNLLTSSIVILSIFDKFTWSGLICSRSTTLNWLHF